MALTSTLLRLEKSITSSIKGGSLFASRSVEGGRSFMDVNFFKIERKYQ
jgi:hypothetical protein